MKICFLEPDLGFCFPVSTSIHVVRGLRITRTIPISSSPRNGNTAIIRLMLRERGDCISSATLFLLAATTILHTTTNPPLKRAEHFFHPLVDVKKPRLHFPGVPITPITFPWCSIRPPHRTISSAYNATRFRLRPHFAVLPLAPSLQCADRPGR